MTDPIERIIAEMPRVGEHQMSGVWPKVFDGKLSWPEYEAAKTKFLAVCESQCRLLAEKGYRLVPSEGDMITEGVKLCPHLFNRDILTIVRGIRAKWLMENQEEDKEV